MQVFEPVTQCVEPRLEWGQGFTRRIMMTRRMRRRAGDGKKDCDERLVLPRPPPTLLLTHFAHTMGVGSSSRRKVDPTTEAIFKVRSPATPPFTANSRHIF